MSENWDEIGRELGETLHWMDCAHFEGPMPVHNEEINNQGYSVRMMVADRPDLSTPERRAVWAGWLTWKAREAWSSPALQVSPVLNAENAISVWICYLNLPGGEDASYWRAPTEVQALMAALSAKAAA